MRGGGGGGKKASKVKRERRSRLKEKERKGKKMVTGEEKMKIGKVNGSPFALSLFLEYRAACSSSEDCSLR